MDALAPTAPESIVLSGADRRFYQTPLLYVWRRGQDVLYVGMSGSGITRPLGKHEHLNAMEPDDTLELLFRSYTCSLGLLSEEARLIARLKPTLNTKRHAPGHLDALTAHPGDCPLSGEHAQVEALEREKAEVMALEAMWGPRLGLPVTKQRVLDYIKSMDNVA